jgi:hypothetical protein
MKKLLQLFTTFIFCGLIALPVVVQSTNADHATEHTKIIPKHHKIIKKLSTHPNTGEVCLSCIGSSQPK